jgi:hypothetical protein
LPLAMLPGRVFHASDKAVLPGRPTVLRCLHADRMRTLHAPGSLSASLLISHSNHQRDGKPIAPNILPPPHHRLPPYGSIRTAPEEAVSRWIMCRWSGSDRVLPSEPLPKRPSRDGSCAGGVVPIESYRHSGTTVADGRMECCERQDWLGARRHVNGVASYWPPCRSSPSPPSALLWAWLRRLGRVHDPTVWCAAMRPHVRFNGACTAMETRWLSAALLPITLESVEF